MFGWYAGLPSLDGVVFVKPSCFRLRVFTNASISLVGFSWVM